MRPADFLGAGLFDAYRDVMRRSGASFDDATKSYTCDIAQVPHAIELLGESDFRPIVAPDLAAQLTNLAETMRADLSRAQAHVAAIDAQVAKLGKTLYAHQRDGIAWLAPRRRAALFDEMGLGKTIQALLAAPPGVPLAVVCPAHLKLNWAAEAHAWRPDLRVRILKGRNKWEWPIAGELVIANYEVLPKLDKIGRKRLIPEERYGTPQPKTCLVVDEAHYCKSAKAQRTQALRATAGAILKADGRAWLLTGTPLTNRPPELWAVLQAAQLAEPAFGTWKEFRGLMGAIEGRWGLRWDGEISTSVPERLKRVSLYRRKADVLDLPPKRRTVMQVAGEFPPDVRKLLDSVLDILAEQGVDLDQAGELVDLTKVTGAAFEQLAKARSALAVAKIPALMEEITAYEEAGEPVVVFSAHRAPINVLSERKGWGVITGSVPSEKRQAIVDAFQRGELKGLGLTIRAGGTGLTLTHACHEIFVDLDFTPAGNSQAEDRCHRISQTRTVFIKRLVADHELDRKVERILREKQELIDAAIEPSAVLRPAVDQAGDITGAATRLEAAIADSIGAVQDVRRPRGVAAPARPAATQRAPADERELWATQALLRLAADDGDRAMEQNGVGFNKFDGMFGHSLAKQLHETGTLSPKQYQAAFKLLAKYHNQIGRPPQEATHG